MQAGKLDRRVTIERFTSAKNELGTIEETWSPLKTVWASYWPLSDSEREKSAEIASVISARFRIRYSADVANVNAKDRLIFEGVTHEIVGVKEIGRRNAIEISTAARSD